MTASFSEIEQQAQALAAEDRARLAETLLKSPHMPLAESETAWAQAIEERLAAFERDDEKSQVNLDKHGINFLDAQSLWNDPDLLEIQAKSDDEPRILVIGLIGLKHWSAVITYRNRAIRLISVRRSRKREVELYESQRF